MPPRFDADQSVLELSVADLLDRTQLRSVGFSNRGGYERMWLGQAIHSEYQEHALREDPTYQREVVLAHRFVHRGWQISINGRLDGLRRAVDGASVVEEIKSVRRGNQLPPKTLELYQRQAQLYVWLLHRMRASAAKEVGPQADPEEDREPSKTLEKSESPDAVESAGAGTEAEPESKAEILEESIRAELVLIEIGSDQIQRQEVPYDDRAIDAAIKRRLNSFLRGFAAAKRSAAARRDFGSSLPFPYPELRNGQDRILEGVEQALEAGEHLLLEATTGIGKTVAAVYPALRHVLDQDKRLFVLTAKTLQQDMAMSVLELLTKLPPAEDGSPAIDPGSVAFSALRLRAKAKMCANDQVICHEEYCPFARDYASKVHSTRILDELLASAPLLEPERIYQQARDAEVCPFEVSLELQERVQVTVCDYNYAFAPYVSLHDFQSDRDLSDVVLVIDEIHNLVGRGRDYYSPDLSAQSIRRTGTAMLSLGLPIHLRLNGLCLELASLVERSVDDALGEVLGEPQAGAPIRPVRDEAVETLLPEDPLWKLRPRFDAAFVDYLEHQREQKSFRADDEFVELYFQLLRFLNSLVVADDAFSFLAERSSIERGFERLTDRRLKILCKDPSRFLGGILRRCHSVIGLSATLSPPEFYRDLLGFDVHRTNVLSIPNPFPEENRRIVIDSAVSTTYRERSQNYSLIADRLAEFADAVPGNCLALFPSYAFLAEVSGRMPLSSKRLFVQERSSSDRQREALLDTLRGAIFGDVFLLAVAGGVFAEGVDYPGDMLQAVAVVGPCLPAVSFEQQLLRDYYDERFERGFEYAFVVPGMTRVVQAAGRLIRSPTDTGVIALFDRRFLQMPYRRHLPQHWLPEEGAGALAGHPAEAAQEFFRR